MAEELTLHFSSVFNGECTSSFPLLGARFSRPKSVRLDQLIITKQLVALVKYALTHPV